VINFFFPAQQWCIRHGFELVELDPLEKPDPDDDFPETLGTDRIIQALHAHSWPNLELKSKLNFYLIQDDKFDYSTILFEQVVKRVEWII
jgi:hypothetical protein